MGHTASNYSSLEACRQEIAEITGVEMERYDDPSQGAQEPVQAVPEQAGENTATLLAIVLGDLQAQGDLF